jgi:protein SCO1/2
VTTRAHRGLALGALVAIAVVTVAWWALALYPAVSAPEWVSRTRLACFGAAPGGLPNAGGWILLVGEPIGMLAILVTVWGDALRRDLQSVAGRPSGRFVLLAAAAALVWSAVAAASLVRRQMMGDAVFAVNQEDGAFAPSAIAVPPLALTDQTGQPFNLASLAGAPVLVTFAFAHCETMCPTLVQNVLRIRRETGRDDIPLVIVTVDPWRDVPARLASIAAAWSLAPGDRVLSGEIHDVNQMLDGWSIARRRDLATGDVVHAMVAVLVNSDGRTATRVDVDVEGLRAILAGL